MDTAMALQMVHDLARENVLDLSACAGDPNLEAERAEQQLALDMVEDLIVNQYGEE